MLALGAASEKDKIKTFDAGSTFLTTTEPLTGVYDKLEIAVERDDLNGDVDEIELVPHMYKGGKEQNLPVLVNFVFSMKMEADLWRLSEVRLGARLPLEDPSFLKAMEENQARQNEQSVMWSMRGVINGEKSFQAVQGNFACTFSELTGGSNAPNPKRRYIFDTQLANGKRDGYNFTIADCDASHYHVFAEPALPGSGQRAFCADESGTLRASADGKAATCLTNGTVVEDAAASAGTSGRVEAKLNTSSQTPAAGQRVRVSQGIAQGLLVSKVQPTYPPEARNARIQGTVVLHAVISKAGDVESLELVSGHPMLAPAAIEAVKQWKYRPYLLNGNAVEVDTQITVNFTLSGQ